MMHKGYPCGCQPAVETHEEHITDETTGQDIVVKYYHDKERCNSIGEIMRTFTAVLYREEDMYVAECPEVGTVSQGRTVEEAVANLKEATELYLEEFPLEDGRRPIITTFEVAEGARGGCGLPAEG
ncbi:type II toxin-antitoxin system HicB family antitoxin [Methanoculleus chikugoensis]|nr:type II toxin-antitoxin system HicB family antitoxin [Methanoculleus chikugoensis]